MDKKFLFALALSLVCYTKAAAHDEGEDDLLLPPPAAPSGAVFKVEYHSHLIGENLGLALPVQDLGECLDACTQSRKCIAFTFVRPLQQPPLFENPQAQCWLKSSLSGKLENTGMISGIKQ